MSDKIGDKELETKKKLRTKEKLRTKNLESLE